MSDEDIMIDGRPLSSLKVAELKEELDNRGLSTKGVKAVLQERLREAIAGNVEEDAGADESGVSAADTVTPQESPVKESPTKRISPRKGRKASEVEPEPEEPQEPQQEEKPADEPMTEEEPAQEKPVEEVVIEKPAEPTAEPEEKEVEAAPQEIEKVEPEKEKPVDAKSESDEEKEVAVEPAVEQKKEVEDNDELDYGDDEEKEQKEDSGEEEDVKKEEEVVAEKEKEKKKEKEKDESERRREKSSSSVKKEEQVRGSVSHRRASSPSSRHPVSNIVHIRGLTRPFTEKALRDFLEKHGGKIEDFWIDKVKSHCFAKFGTVDEATNVRDQLNDTMWPDGNPKKLAIVFETAENMKMYKEGDGEKKLPEVVTIGTLTGASRASRLSSTSQTSVLTGKANFQMTLQNAIRDNDKLESERKEKRGSLASRLTRADNKDKEKEKEKEKPKEEERKRRRSETPPFSRGAGFMDEKKAKKEEELKSGKKREESRRERQESETEVVLPDEPPKMSMEQIFKKTVTTPALYYLPLTDEEVAAKSSRKTKVSESEKERPERSNRPSERATERSDRDRSNRDRDRRDRDRVGGDRDRERGDRGGDRDRQRRRD